MTVFSWVATALSAIVLAWLAAFPEPLPAAGPRVRTVTDDDALRLRVEREVTAPLRERETDRWRFSRVHRPTPAYRTAADPERADRRHAAFRIAVTQPLGGVERDAWLVRVDRSSGAIDIAPALRADAEAAPRWQPLARVLSPDLPVR
jgi:hypothetical protein